MKRPRVRAMVGLVTLLFAAAACVPTRESSELPLVALLNGPAQAALTGSAEGVQSELERDTGKPFELASAFSMRFLESHTDLFHSRAAPGAARIARSQGADLAIMVGAPVLVRDVAVSRDSASRRIDVQVALEAQVVDPRTDAVVQVLRTRTFSGSRVEANDAPVVDVEDDTTVQALRDAAVPELAAAIRAELPYLVRELLIGSSGG
ncbi:MAG: hypothetical protein R6W77_13350 [Trueperaceae bacterium]